LPTFFILDDELDAEVDLEAGEQRIYSWQPIESGEATLTFSGPCEEGGLAPWFTLYAERLDGTLERLAYSEDEGLDCPSLTLDVEGDQRYLLAIEGRDGAPVSYSLSYTLIPLDQDADGVPDSFDCAPLDPEIPAFEEIPGNGVDDDCDPFTPDTLLAEGEVCDRAGLEDGCLAPLECLIDAGDGRGLCGLPSFEEDLPEGTICDANLRLNGCAFGLECIDPTGIGGPFSFDSATIADRDGRCLSVTTLIDQGEQPLSLPIGGIGAFRMSTFGAGRIRLETRGPDGDCPFDTQLRLYEEGFDFFGVSYSERAFDDNGGEGGCSLIQQAFPEGGSFLLIVNELGADEAIELSLRYEILED
ncbi:MAG: hypothetical protein VYD19_10700, partial [Myxococcota bacterium]|nr:hypothetical protein [Myxococcota bacterium]